MNNTEKFLYILLFILFIAYIWGIPKDQTFNAIVTLLAAGIGAGIIFENTKKRRRS
jgi:hypothetical protein